MSNQDKITVKIEQTHTCGQVFEQIVHMEPDDLFSLTLSADPPFSLSFLDERHPVLPFSLPPPSKRKLELVGHTEKLEVNGIEMKENRLLCKRCGADVLFPKVQT